MVRKRVERHLGFLVTTAIGGVVFLLPLVVVGALLAEAWQIVLWIAAAISVPEWLQPLMPDSFGVAASEVLIGIAAVVAICFLCGVLATRRLGRWFTNQAEGYLTFFFPRYVVFKEQLASNLGGERAGGQLKPVRVRVGPFDQFGMEVERDVGDGHPEGEVVVYLPSAPDPWSGRVVIVPTDAVTPIDGDPGDFLAIFEKLGRDTFKYRN
ncbi:MAG: DUF502 domain-containing protein [Planctomycetota bacterium]